MAAHCQEHVMSEGEERFLQRCANWSLCHRLWSMRCPTADVDPWVWCACWDCDEYEEDARAKSGEKRASR